jgi:phosphatidylglycerophosphatase A
LKKTSFSVFVATWFKTGLIPPVLFKGMAGTYGSFFALPLCYLALMFSRDSGKIFTYLLFLVIIYLFGLITVPFAEKELGIQTDWKGKEKNRDQNQIVIDEVLGMLIGCIPILFVSKMWVSHFVIAFVLFRIFDIVKVPPARYFDRMKNASGVMMDDVIAGIYAAIVLQLVIIYVL